jgi:hypothetical protein
VCRRNDLIELGLICKNFKYTRDVHTYYYLLKIGKGYYFSEVFGVYNRHSGGICSMVSPLVNSTIGYNIYKELYDYTKDIYCKIRIFALLLSRLKNKFYEKKEDKKRIVSELARMFYLIIIWCFIKIRGVIHYKTHKKI